MPKITFEGTIDQLKIYIEAPKIYKALKDIRAHTALAPMNHRMDVVKRIALAAIERIEE